MTTISLPMNTLCTPKTKICMAVFLFSAQKLMQYILRSDYKMVANALTRIANDDVETQSIIEERCDGNRNILHASALMCAPTSNKEHDNSANSAENRVIVSPRSASTSTSNAATSINSSSFTSGCGTITEAASFTTNAIVNRESSRTTLRDMMSRLINNDEIDHPNTDSSVNDHSYTPAKRIPNLTLGGAEAKSDDANNYSTTNQTANSTNDPLVRRDNALAILKKLLTNAALARHLIQLLSAKDAQGRTPFMLAVNCRAYEAALTILDVILMLTEKDATLKESMIFPYGTPVDQSPLHVLCYNDTCSFTWTGADHINQKIYECRTCGLTGSLCCCTECALVCHKGHDCKLKHTSPTAYCDCWEKCKCKALIAGNQNKRITLLSKLTSCTDLATKFNGKGESIILFLIQTIARQTVEQRQWRASARMRGIGSSNNNNNCGSGGGGGSAHRKSAIDIDADTPDHDLEPPKFARVALERLLQDWNAVKSMIMAGADKIDIPAQQHHQANAMDSSNTESYNIYLQSQSGSTLLDKFTHSLLAKCSGDHLSMLLKTLVTELRNETVVGRKKEAENVARRFVRSVARVFVIFNLEKQPNPEKKKNAQLASNKHIQSCINVFETLQKISIEELCEVSEALIAPVRLGVVRPTAPFNTTTTLVENTDDIFSVDPLALTSVADAELSTPNDVLNEAAYNQQSYINMETMDDMREPVNEETLVGTQRSSHDEEAIEANRNNDGIQEDESDIDFPFNDAETDSDSDDNQSNQGAERSVQTGATVGSESDIGVLFLEDDSVDSSPQEEASDEGESEDNSEEFISNEQLERRSNPQPTRGDLGPQTMQWAIRNRDTSRSSVRLPPGSNLVFIDPVAIRRSAAPTNAAVSTSTTIEQHTMANSASNLSRAYGIVVRTISDLLNSSVQSILNNTDGIVIHKIQLNELVEIQTFVEERFKKTWDWMYSVMETTEAQLKFGAYLTNYTDPAHPLHPLNTSAHANTSQNQSSSTTSANLIGSYARREFFTYCLSLMRAHTSEHRDALPVLDVTALRHIAYILDAFIFYLRNDAQFFDRSITTTTTTTTTTSGVENAQSSAIDSNDTDDETYGSDDVAPMEVDYSDISQLSATCPRKRSFFKRSDSTLSLGCLAPEGFDLPIDVAMPLADKPHLLQPNSKRQDLFANVPLLDSLKSSSATGSADAPATYLGYSNYREERKSLDQAIQCELDVDVGINTKETPLQSFDKITRKRLKCGGDVGVGVGVGGEHGIEPNFYVQAKKKKCSEEEKNFSEECGGSSVDFSQFNEKTEKSLRPEVIMSPNKRYLHAENPIDIDSTSASAFMPSVIVRVATGKGAHLEECSPTAGVDNNTQSFSTLENLNVEHKKTYDMLLTYQRGSLFNKSHSTHLPSWNFLLSRWKLSFDLFGRVFMDDVGMEHSSVLPELRGFSVKEVRFRRHMEKLRNAQQRDLTLSKLERDRDSLIAQTFKELNTQFGNQSRRIHPSITFNRVKVTFKDEPGEGSGVARSFYTSISEALLAHSKLPNLETVQGTKYCGVPFGSVLRSRVSTTAGGGRDPPNLQRRNTGTKIFWRNVRERKILNYDAKIFAPPLNDETGGNEHFPSHLRQIGDRLYPKIQTISPANAPKITGMLLELPTPVLLATLGSDEALRQKVNEALEIISAKQKSEQCSSSICIKRSSSSSVSLEPAENDDEPLFYSPGKRGFYTPRQGLGSVERLNAFRNVGRLIGLCLLQNELLPIFLQRHVLKYILGRRIQFHDLAFYDPALYESFRQILLRAQSDSDTDKIKDMELFFVIDLKKEEGGGTHELVVGGRETSVTSLNIFEYVRRYTEYRLITTQERALESLKDGVFDVLPENCMNSLTAEDLRLLLNGVGDINVSTLISYTTFNDESSEGPEKLLKFKRWFWAIVEKMSVLEKQDLVYFWTGSPALPASEEGFQPLPSVTIRPADDAHLPTANTCISRLYIPLYSTKTILRSKLLMAIKSKNFGFV